MAIAHISVPARTTHHTTLTLKSQGAATGRAAVTWGPLAVPAVLGHSPALPLPLHSPMVGDKTMQAGASPWERASASVFFPPPVCLRCMVNT
ncbi:hypothetical protein E2C01_041900 [Portunus trituberculatus]|uniref:Uncharacterized protein n=1 Tax=Portunus trituberculatus TaxID=210409 RepID=A0A5B7FSX1_PORTR|nr:hypothetical protein [Portunus trituberculatus]